MATSIKLSELQSLANLTPTDLFLVTDAETSSSRKVSYETLKAATITGVEQTISDLIGDAPETLNQLSELADALQNNPNILSELQDAVASNDTEIANEVSARGVAVTGEQTAREEAVAALQALITALQTEAAARLARLETLETTVDNLDIDIAPETLNSIDELAAAMGGDPTFLTTLQARVSTIENDNATQTELDAYKAEIEDRNLQLALAYDTPLYIDTLFGG
jgi:chromosome segregation ATPase